MRKLVLVLLDTGFVGPAPCRSLIFISEDVEKPESRIIPMAWDFFVFVDWFLICMGRIAIPWSRFHILGITIAHRPDKEPRVQNVTPVLISIQLMPGRIHHNIKIQDFKSVLTPRLSTGLHSIMRSGLREYEVKKLRSPTCSRQENTIYPPHIHGTWSAP